jgi:hypothetical protein
MLDRRQRAVLQVAQRDFGVGLFCLEKGCGFAMRRALSEQIRRFRVYPPVNGTGFFSGSSSGLAVGFDPGGLSHSRKIPTHPDADCRLSGRSPGSPSASAPSFGNGCATCQQGGPAAKLIPDWSA